MKCTYTRLLLFLINFLFCLQWSNIIRGCSPSGRKKKNFTLKGRWVRGWTCNLLYRGLVYNEKRIYLFFFFLFFDKRFYSSFILIFWLSYYKCKVLSIHSSKNLSKTNLIIFLHVKIKFDTLLNYTFNFVKNTWLTKKIVTFFCNAIKFITIDKKILI